MVRRECGIRTADHTSSAQLRSLPFTGKSLLNLFNSFPYSGPFRNAAEAMIGCESAYSLCLEL